MELIESASIGSRVTVNAHTTEPTESRIKNALVYLASVCDHATSQDARGFNGRDADFGHKLARQTYPLTPKQQHAALRMLTTYTKQLERAGHTLPCASELPCVDTDPQHYTARPAATAVVVTPNTIRMAGKDIAINFKYTDELYAKVVAIKGRRYDPPTKTWLVPFERLAAVLAVFPNFQIDQSITDYLAAERKLQEQAKRENAARVDKLISVVGDLTQPLPSGKVPFQHQRDGVRWLIEHGRAILADDMGLGKSMTALLVARAYRQAFGCYIFVVAPVSLRTNWLREAEGAGVPIEFFSWAKLPQPIENDYFLIADESHFMQNFRARRTRAMLELADAPSCKGIVLCTGTPITNGRPINLFPLLQAARHPLAKDKKAYEKFYCLAGPTPFSKWDNSGAAHLDVLYEKSRDVILRRKKDHCLDLPEKTRVMRAAEISADDQSTYDRTLEELRARYQERLHEGKIKAGGEALVELGYLRHAGSIAKASTAIEMAQEVNEQSGQCVIFVAFKDTGRRIAQELQCEFLSGDGDAKLRQPMVDRFQAGQFKNIVCSYGAGGVGITLTAAQTVILVDRAWTPGDVEQSESRIHRIGQRNACTAYWLQAFEIDDIIDQILQAKAERIELALEGRRKTMRGIGNLHEMAQQVLEFVMEGK